MNKAKTLKRHLGNPRPFLSVAWDSNDIPSLVSVNPNIKWRDINWKQVEVRVLKLRKLIYKASSCGEDSHGLKTAKDLKAVNFLNTL